MAGKVSTVRPDHRDRDVSLSNSFGHHSFVLAGVERDIEVEEEGVVPKGVSVPYTPSQREIDEHELTHIPYRSWCAHCVRARAREDGNFRSPDDIDEADRVTPRVNREIVEVCPITTAEQESMLKGLLERHAAATGSEKAAALLSDWSAARSRFKVLVPPSERAAMGLEDKQAVAA